MTVRLDDLALSLQLSLAHDRGVFDESGLFDVLQELNAGKPLTLDHVAKIFGAVPTYRVLTVRDETAWQLVRDASRLLNEDLDKLSWGQDVQDWNRALANLTRGDTP